MHLGTFWGCPSFRFPDRLSRAFKEGRAADTGTMSRFTEGDVDRSAGAEFGDRAVSGASIDRASARYRGAGLS